MEPGSIAFLIGGAVIAVIAGSSDEPKDKYEEDVSQNVAESRWKGELIIGKILTDLGVKYERQYHIREDTHRFDFFLPNHNCLIEYDGEQHFDINSHYHRTDEKGTSEQKFKKQREKDVKKNNLAWRNDMKLIRIDHEKDVETIEHIIRKVLKLKYDRSKLPSDLLTCWNITYSSLNKYDYYIPWFDRLFG